MADYTQITDFSAKDSLPSGDSNKLVKGAEFDAEFDAISTAIATKYDSDDIASVAEAQAESLDTKLITPSKLASWSDDNAGIVGQLRDLTDPGADRLVFWDDSASAAAFLTVSTGLSLSGTSLTTDDSQIVHDNLSGFVANEHIDHSGVSISAGTGLTGGGAITSSRTLSLDTGNARNVDHSGVSISAGNGLTGGGAITASRTLTLGTPGTISGSTGNSVTASSHTHALDGGVLRQASEPSGVVNVQNGGSPSGGSNGDIYLIW